MSVPRARAKAVVIILAIKPFMAAFSLAGAESGPLNLRLWKCGINRPEDLVLRHLSDSEYDAETRVRAALLLRGE
jgi:hypothetical protein